MANVLQKITLTSAAMAFLIAPQLSARAIKMVTAQWAPFYSDQLPRGGPVAEIAVEAFKRTGHQATVEYLPWSRALRKATALEADIVLGAYYTDVRAKTFNFSAPILTVNVGLVTNSNTGIKSYSSLRDLSHFRIGVAKGWANSPEFDAASYLNKDLAKNQILNIRKLSYDRVDMIAIAFEVFRYEDSKIHPHSPPKRHVFLEPLLSKSTLHLMISKQFADDAEIISDFNRGLQQMKDDGSYAKILKAHRIDPSAAP